MAKPPAVIIIARHGARLDAANKQWHLTSPTPYDPPLTYGGWSQAQALGARIASLLRSREEGGSDPNQPDITPGSSEQPQESGLEGRDLPSTHKPRRNKKHKVIVHTSPFLRCVQTSIALSAGINQVQSVPQSSHSSSKHFYSGSPHINPTDSEPSRLSAILEPEDGAPQKARENIKATTTGGISKSSVRIDAFLGEWLSPDYFEQITPPPGSVMMVAGAKTELLRRGEVIDPGSEGLAPGNFPGGWRSTSIGGTSAVGEGDGSFRDMTNLNNALPNRNRAGSYDSMADVRNKQHNSPKISTDVNTGRVGYIPPTPAYAVSPADPIPTGYVAHARDACVDVDYQWDSMRKPQDWGNGGDYGEEWSSMHLRFRNGLQRMIDWYRSQDTSPAHGSVPESPFAEDDEDDSTDTVLVLVTHGAGCNALIGALTNQPVLLDVGMASLTMAVRKDIVAQGEGQSDRKPDPEDLRGRRRPSSSELAVSDEYDVKLLVSTDHLRPGYHPLQMPSLPSPKMGTMAPKPSFRQRYGSGSSSPHGSFSIGDPASRSFGGVHRASSTSSRVLQPGRSASGLWGAIPVGDGASESGDDIIPNFEGPVPQSSGASTPSDDQSRAGSRSQRGLWGSTSSSRERDPDAIPKRRWTVNERHS
ncbi:hypothetical protein FQN54_004515 [Arachnomyces sp. PD_36]|nr:hypothetical protein FQN54_004515 [Arachnomyces sp. PD_36]